jgi:hypothetical protein
MLLDATDAADAFGRNAQRLPLFCGLIIGNPQMHDAIADDYVFRPNHLRPFFTGQLPRTLSDIDQD